MNSISCSKLSRIAPLIRDNKIYKLKNKLLSNKIIGIQSEKNIKIQYPYTLKVDKKTYNLQVNNFNVKCKYDAFIYRNNNIIGFIEYKRRMRNIFSKVELRKRESDLIQLSIYKKTFIHNFKINPKILLMQENESASKTMDYTNSKTLDRIYDNKIKNLYYS